MSLRPSYTPTGWRCSAAPAWGSGCRGSASSYRRVVSALLRSSMPEKELAEVLCGRMPENEIFSTLLDTKTAEKVWAALQQFEQEEQLHLPDAGFLALAIHCTLTIQQLRQGGDKGSAPRGLRPAGNHAARLVAALKEKGFSDVKAWMLGSGELEAECRQLIESCNLSKNVELKGFQKNPYPYISRARLLCMTSRWEGFGLVLLEANILGVPVISTRTAGAEEVLGEAAEELCDGDEEMAEKVIGVLSGEEEYCHFTEMANQRVEHLVTLESYMNKIKRIYEKE